jgi:LysR family transcriptional regulator, low CO2-responsive transcriptional regulator
MTLTQLKVFVLVTRLGSVKGAASALGVSEPAVSQALAALRLHLGDPLIVKSPSGMGLTPAGQRIVGIASQMVNLSVEAEAAVRVSQGAPELLRVVATSTLADAVAPSLLQAFTGRVGNVEVTLGTASTDEMAALLRERLADVALGPKLDAEAGELSVEPLLRWRLALTASPSHHLAGRSVRLRELATETWLVDPAAADPQSVVGRLLHDLGVPAAQVRVFPNMASALAEAAAGTGVAPAVDHLLGELVEQRTLTRLAVVGPPLDAMWWVSVLPHDRRSPMAARLRRFLGTPDAMHAMHRTAAGVPATRFKPPVYVTLWS